MSNKCLRSIKRYKQRIWIWNTVGERVFKNHRLQSCSVFFKLVHPCLLLYLLCYLWLLLTFCAVLFMFHWIWCQFAPFEFRYISWYSSSFQVLLLTLMQVCDEKLGSCRWSSDSFDFEFYFCVRVNLLLPWLQTHRNRKHHQTTAGTATDNGAPFALEQSPIANKMWLLIHFHLRNFDSHVIVRP